MLRFSHFRFLHRQGLSRPKLRRHWLGNLCSKWLFSADLWRFRRQNLALGWLIGCIASVTPLIGFQLAMAIPVCLVLRANIPVTVGLIMMSNPVTIIPLMGFCLWIGCLILDMPFAEFRGLDDARLAWKPLMVGCLATGVTLGVTGYLLIMAFWRDHKKPGKPVEEIPSPS